MLKNEPFSAESLLSVNDIFAMDESVKPSTETPGTKKRKQRSGSTHTSHCACGRCEKDVSGSGGAPSGHRLPTDATERAHWLLRLNQSFDGATRKRLMQSTNERVHPDHFYADGDPRIDVAGHPGRYHNGTSWRLKKGTRPGRGPAEWAQEKVSTRESPIDRSREAAASSAEAVAAAAPPSTARAVRAAASHLRVEVETRKDVEAEAAELREKVRELMRKLEGERVANRLGAEREAELCRRLKRALAESARRQHEHEAAVTRQTVELDNWKQQNHTPLRHAMLRDDPYMKKRVPQLTGFKSYEAFLLFVDCLKADGVLDSVQLYRGQHDDSGKLLSASSSSAAAFPGRRNLDSTNAVFFTLFILRTGIEPIVAGPLFGCMFGIFLPPSTSTSPLRSVYFSYLSLSQLPFLIHRSKSRGLLHVVHQFPQLVAAGGVSVPDKGATHRFDAARVRREVSWLAPRDAI